MTLLVKLGARVTGHNMVRFGESYDNILPQLFSLANDWALYTLLQFYNSALRCFTFQDYQLAPTLDEYEYILQIKIQHRISLFCVPEKVRLDLIVGALYLSLKDVADNWKPNGDTHGFYLKFLISKAQEFADKEDQKAFNALS